MSNLDAAPAGGGIAAATGLRPSRLARTLVVDAVLPWLAVQLLTRLGVAEVTAFTAAAAFPAASVLLEAWRHRRLELIGVAVLLALGGGIAMMLLVDDVRFAVVKAAPAYGLFGLACLLSLPRQRPLMFFVGRHFSTGGDLAQRVAWDQRLAQPGFRSAMRRLTAVWGIACLLEAGLGVWAAVVLPPSTALVLEPILGLGTIAGLLFWTVRFAQARRARG